MQEIHAQDEEMINLEEFLLGLILTITLKHEPMTRPTDDETKTIKRLMTKKMMKR